MAASCNLSGATLFKPTFSDISSATAGVAAAQAATLTRAKSDFDIMRSSERVESAIRRLEISNSSMQKAPFLPRLPEKIFQTYRLTSSHLINNSYVDNATHDISNRPLFKREKSFTYKGDLLRASQICLLVDSSMSETIKHIKTADTPWIRGVNTNKPYKPILHKSKIEMSEFLSKQQQKRPVTSKITEKSNRTFSVESKPTLQKNPASLQRCKTTMSANSRSVQFAEDLFTEHITRSFSDFSSLGKEKETQAADIALHALDTVWELGSYALKSSPYLMELYDEQEKLQTPEYKKSLKNTKMYGPEKIERMFHIVLKITDSQITKHCLAVALGNLYHPNLIDVPGKYVAGTLAAANILKFEALINGTIKKMAHSLSKKTIADCYLTSKRYQHKEAMATCESWLELYLMSDLKSLSFLKQIPMDLLTKIIKSKTLFVKDEHSKLMIILYWIFFHLNPSEDESPTESVITTYFSSFPKDKSLVEKYTEFKEILFSVRIFGISKSNLIVGIQQMNLYPHSYLVKIMLEIQQSLGHGGDMNIYRSFESYAVRQGFTVDVDSQEQYSEIFSLYGFYFELIAEKIEQKDNNYIYQLHIQRLSSKNPVLTYEQSQLEMFSLRNDRLCTYSISVQYWDNGKQMIQSTGQKRHVFGIKLSQLSPIFEIEIPFQPRNDNLDETAVSKRPREISVMYSFNFPND